jgi:protein-tyrosine phosphatase
MSKWFRSYGFADVHDKLLVGAYPLDREDVGMLEWMKIERILNLVEDQEYEPGERRQVEHALYAAGIVERRLSLTDYGRLPAPKLELAVAEINEWLDQGHRVYVHCRAGWQRSAAIAAGVVALREGVDIEDALARVRRRKPSADPLPQQRADLLQWWAERKADAEASSGAAASATGAEASEAVEAADASEASGESEAGGDGGERPTASETGSRSGSSETVAASSGEETDDVLEWLTEHDPARRGGGAADVEH